MYFVGKASWWEHYRINFFIFRMKIANSKLQRGLCGKDCYRRIRETFM